MQANIHEHIENLCFKGGGMTGNAFVGVLKALTELNILSQIKRLIGSSAGAIFAGCIACGISYDQLYKIIMDTDFNKFCDSPWGFLGKTTRIVEYMGLYNGDYFYSWYRSILTRTIKDPDITFKQVYTQFGKELVITTTDLTDRKLVYLNHHDNPDMKICDAVRRSMSIPGIFIPIKEIKADGITHWYVDGGCTNNFPLDYFDGLYSSPDEAFKKTVGFDLIEDQSSSAITNIINLIIALVYTDTEVIEKLRLKPMDQQRIIKIDTLKLNFIDFGMTKENIEQLIKNGYDSTMNFFH